MDNSDQIDYMEMSLNPVIETGIKRRTDIITAIIFLCLIFVPTVLFWAMPDKKISEDENRSLQQLPVFSFEKLMSGKYTTEMGKYYADQFPFRNTFVGAKTIFSYAFFINENKGAVIAKDGWLIQRFDIYSEKSIAEKSANELGGDLTFAENMANIKNNCNYINIFAGNIKELFPDINLTVAVPPRKIDVMTNKLPAFFPVERHEKYYTELEKYINKDIYVDLLEVLRSRNDEYIYYKTDHHWTTLGAYYAYAGIYDAPSKESFAVEIASDDFYGTTWSKAGAKWIEPDIMEYYRFSNDDKYTTVIYNASGQKSNNEKESIAYNDNRKVLIGFYDRDILKTKDKYSFFLGGINAHISIYKIQKAGNPLPKEPENLLLITDSFGLCFAPFLVWHYDNIEMLDLRFFKENVYDFIRDNNIDEILILHCMENFSTQNNLIGLTLK